jgi:hypothetical protein
MGQLGQEQGHTAQIWKHLDNTLGATVPVQIPWKLVRNIDM